MKQQLQPKEGEIVEIFRDFSGFNQSQPEFLNQNKKNWNTFLQKSNIRKSDGKVIGKHQGAQYYTIGQSKGLGIGGHKESCFVISRDMENNILFVGESHSFLGLYKKL